MISYVGRFPWHKTDMTTVKQRFLLVDTCVTMMKMLRRAVVKGEHPNLLTEQLWRRFYTMCMKCEGFTVVQKHGIARLAEISVSEQRSLGLPRFAGDWGHLWSMLPKPGAPLDLVEVSFVSLPVQSSTLSSSLFFSILSCRSANHEASQLQWYITLVREETLRAGRKMAPNVQARVARDSGVVGGADNVEKTEGLYLGLFYREVGFEMGPAFDNMTLADLATREFSTMDRIVRRVLPDLD